MLDRVVRKLLVKDELSARGAERDLLRVREGCAGSYATETLPALRKHLDTAQSLNDATKTANPATSPAVIAVPAPAAGVPAPVPETTGGENAR